MYQGSHGLNALEAVVKRLLSHPADWYRNKIAEELQLVDTDNPSLRSYEEKIKHIRKNLPITPLDIPWRIGHCLKYGIPGDVIPSLIRIREKIGDRLTIRRARWMGLLYPAVIQLATEEYPIDSPWFEQRLSFIGREYAIREQFCEAMEYNTDTSDFDTLFFTYGDISDEALGAAIADNIFRKRPIPQVPDLTSDEIEQIEEKLGKITPNEREQLYHEMDKQLALDDLVFTSVNFKPIDPCVLTHAFSRMARQIGLNDLRFHDLRHTFASLMLLRGAKPKVINEALGHASVAFTMDTYSHIIEGMQEDMMALLDDVLPAGKSGVDSKINV